MAFQMQANERDAVNVCQPCPDGRDETVHLRIRIQEPGVQEPGVRGQESEFRSQESQERPISALSSAANSLRCVFGKNPEAILTFEFVFGLELLLTSELSDS